MQGCSNLGLGNRGTCEQLAVTGLGVGEEVTGTIAVIQAFWLSSLMGQAVRTVAASPGLGAVLIRGIHARQARHIGGGQREYGELVVCASNCVAFGHVQVSYALNQCFHEGINIAFTVERSPFNELTDKVLLS